MKFFLIVILYILIEGILSVCCPIYGQIETSIINDDFSSNGSSWTEYDPQSKISFNQRVNFTSWIRYNEGFVQKSIIPISDFNLEFDFNITSIYGNGKLVGPGISDYYGSVLETNLNNGIFLLCVSGSGGLRIYIYTVENGAPNYGVGTSSSGNFISIALNNTYYARLKKTGNNVLLSLFSDASRANPISGSPVSIITGFDNSNLKFNNLYALNSPVSSPINNDETSTGWIDNINLTSYAPPSGFKIFPDNNRSCLTWNSMNWDNFSRIYVYRDFQLIDSVVSNSSADTSFIDNDLINGQTYSYFIRSKDIGENMSYNSDTLVAVPNLVANGLIAFYPFDGNSFDESGNGNNGTVNGPVLTPDRYGSANGAYFFDGIDNYITMGSDNSLKVTDGITMSLWINNQGSSGNPVILDKEGEYQLWLDSDDTLGFAVANTDPGWAARKSSIKVEKNRWNYITMTYSAATGIINFYKNGQLRFERTGSGQIGDFYPGQNELWLGFRQYAPGGGDYFHGGLDDIRIYNKELSDSSIQQIYANYYPPSSFKVIPGDKEMILIWDSARWNYLNEIYIYRNSELLDSLTVSSDADTIYADSDLIPGKPYSYYIRSKDNWENVSISSDTLQDSPYTFDPPAGLSVQTGDKEILLSWDSTNWNYYDKVYIYRDFQLIDSVTVTNSGDTLFINTDLANDQSYLYYILSRDINGNLSFHSDTLHVSPAIIPDGLIAYYPFNGNANDESGNGHDGNVIEAVVTTDRSGNSDYAYNFDGSNDQIQLGDFTGVRSISLWLYNSADITNDNFYGYLLTSSGQGGVNWGNTTLMYSNEILSHVTYLINGGNNSAYYWTNNDINDTIPIGWHYFVMKWDTTNLDYRVFIDNIDYGIGRKSNGPPENPDFTALTIGSDAYSWNGNIDEVRLYNRSLDSAEIAQIYENYYPPMNFRVIPGDCVVTVKWDAINLNYLDQIYIYRDLSLLDSVSINNSSDTIFIDAQLINGQSYSYFIRSKDIWGNISISSDTLFVTPLAVPDGIIAYYPFNNNAIDESGNGNNGTTQGGVSAVNDRFSYSNSAYEFNGTDSRILIDDNETQTLNKNFTISCFIKPYEINGFHDIIAKYDEPNSPYREFILSIYDGKIRFWWSENGTADPGFYDTLLTDLILPVNTWSNIAVTFNAGKVKLYANSILLTEKVSTVDSIHNSLSSIGIGNRNSSGSSYWYKGIIDDVRLYDRCLDSSEIEKIYKNYYPPLKFNLIPGDKRTSIRWDSANWNFISRVFIYRNLTLIDSISVSSDQDTIYEDVNLTPGHKYSYYIKSKDQWGYISISTDTLQIVPYTFDPPSSFSIEAGDHEVRLSWDSVDWSYYDKIYVFRDYSLVDSLTFNNNTDTVYDDTGLNIGQAYSYFIRSTDVLGNLSNPSDTLQAIPFNHDPPSGLTIESGNKQIKIIWDSKDWDYFQKIFIYRDLNLIDSISISSSSDTFYTDTGLTFGHLYSYYIRSLDKLGNYSNFSDTLYAMPFSLDAPTGFSAFPGDGNSILTWDSSNWNYRNSVFIYRDLILIDSVSVTGNADTAYIDNGLINNQTYSYYIRSRDIWGNFSYYSDTLDVIPEAVQPPAPGSGIVDDSDNVFIWSYASGFPSVDQYEYSLDSGLTWATCSDTVIQVGNITLPAGYVQVRVKENLISGTPSGEILTNNLAFLIRPDKPAVTSDSICYGQTSPSLYAAGDNITWYGDAGHTDTLAYGNYYQPSYSSSGDLVFYVTQSLNAQESEDTTAILTVSPIPLLPFATDTTYNIISSEYTLIATGIELKWYDDSLKNNFLTQDDTLKINSSSVGDSLFYVTQTVAGCESGPAEVRLSVRLPDTTPPEFNNLVYPNFYEPPAAFVRVSADITDESGIDSVLFCYRKITSKDSSNWLSMTLDTGDNFYYDLPGREFDEAGILFYLKAVDRYGNSSVIGPGEIFLNYTFDNPLTIKGLAYGSNISDYQIVSFPVMNNDLDLQVNNALGTQVINNQMMWRLYHFENKADSNVEYHNFKVQNGLGYWLISRNPLDIPISGKMEYDNENLFVMKLDTGWNQIGNPYLFNIGWDDVLNYNIKQPNISDVSSSLSVYIPGTNRGIYTYSNILNAFRGAFVRSESAINLEIPIYKNPAINNQRTIPQSHPDIITRLHYPEWYLPINLYGSTLGNETGGIGMVSNAEEGIDQFDQYVLPRFVKYLDLIFENPALKNHKITNDIIPVKEEYKWDFVVETNLSDNTICLRWDPNLITGLEYDLKMLDRERFILVDLKRQSSFCFKPMDHNDFSIYYGNEEFINKCVSGDQFMVGNPYPNPFYNTIHVPFVIPDTDHNTIETIIYDQVGNQLFHKKIINIKPGLNEITWNGISDTGKNINNGLFQLVITYNHNGKSVLISRKLLRR